MAGVAALLICALLAAVVFAPLPGQTLFIRTLHDFAHGPIFGGIAVLVLLVVRRHGFTARFAVTTQYLIALAGAVLLGVAAELAQIPVGRDATAVDILNDLLGAAAALAACAAFDKRLRGRRKTLATAGLAAAVLTGVLAAPVLISVAAYARRDNEFPVLADFSKRLDTYFMTAQRASVALVALPEHWAKRRAELALRVRFADAPFPGVDFFEPAPDWRGYEALALDLTNPADAELELRLRVHDVFHDQHMSDRFNTILRLPPRTRTVVRIPLADIAAGPQTRPMDLRRVADWQLFRIAPPAATELYLSRAWLE